MPAVQNKRFYDLHPFTPDSTLMLSGGLRLPDKCVLACKLYPVTADTKATCGCISKIGRNGTTGVVTVESDTGTFLCDIYFDLTNSDQSMHGTATDIRGMLCGHMILRHDCLPLFFGSHKPDNTALKLLPSSCMLVPIEEGAQYSDAVVGVALHYNGTPVSGIVGGANHIKGADYSGLYIDLSSDESGVDKIVRSISINGVTLSGEHLVLLSKGGGLVIKNSNGSLSIGN